MNQLQSIFRNVFLVLMIGISACNGGGAEVISEQPAENLIPVKIMPLQQDAVAPVFRATGYFTTDDETYLSFKNGGIVNSIFVKEGDKISKGQLLATLNTVEITAMTEQANLALEKAQRDYDRAVNLYKDSVATLEQMQNAKTALDLAQQQKTSASFNRQHAEIRAMQNGFVLRKLMQEGEVVGPGTPVLQVNSAGNKRWLLKVRLSDFQWAAVQQGDSAIITTDVAPGRSLKATVSKKAEGVDPATGTFMVQLSVDAGNDIPVASGLFGKAVIYPSRKTTTWRIPYDALLDGEVNTGFVFVTNDKATAQKVKVSVAGIENNFVSINHGLEDSRFLIVSGSAYLNDGAAIKVTE